MCRGINQTTLVMRASAPPLDQHCSPSSAHEEPCTRGNPLPSSQEDAPKPVTPRVYRPGSIYKTSSPHLFFTTHVDDDHTRAEIQRFPVVFFFSSEVPESYRSFCDDNGPVDISQVVECCRDIHARTSNPKLQKRPLVFYTYADPTCVTNSVLLLCAYLVLYERHTIEEAYAPFEAIQDLPVANFHDATFCAQTFRLTVTDVLNGLLRAINLKWVDPFTFDMDAYRGLHECATHDICAMTPKFVALATPKDRADEYTDARPASTNAALLRALGVTDLVRLNENPAYTSEPFTCGRINVHAMEFPDCSCPSFELVEAFLDKVDACEGKVAVHCLAGLGRTGTMIGCHMIKHHGFTAAEAIGYLRLMRPGSVIGPQQHFLEQIQCCTWSENRPLGVMGPASRLSVCKEEEVGSAGGSCARGVSFGSEAELSAADTPWNDEQVTLRWRAQDLPDQAMEKVSEDLDRLSVDERARLDMARSVAAGQSKRARKVEVKGVSFGTAALVGGGLTDDELG